MNTRVIRNGKELTVIPEGRLDTYTANDFEQTLADELKDAESLIVDLSDVNYISSAGLRVLLTYAQEMEERGGTIKAVNVNEIVHQTFDLTGFLEILNVD
ncbi:MAG: STAS domain-containing protein [Candidatus Limivicinus sp.]|jgi:anti-sigma B factor antagonist